MTGGKGWLALAGRGLHPAGSKVEACVGYFVLRTSSFPGQTTRNEAIDYLAGRSLLSRQLCNLLDLLPSRMGQEKNLSACVRVYVCDAVFLLFSFFVFFSFYLFSCRRQHIIHPKCAFSLFSSDVVGSPSSRSTSPLGWKEGHQKHFSCVSVTVI